jgi:2-amino-4-hydroxy-6-hydroxymethyldihydropteridine diphosphokinase
LTRVVLSVGSNMGDRLARLHSVVDGIADAVQAVSPIYETDAWGGVEQKTFLNAVIVAEDPAREAEDWLRLAQQLEHDNDRVREQHWGPRTLDVDLVCCHQVTAEGTREVVSDRQALTLPHPFAHQRAFVLVPWLAVDPNAELTIAGQVRPVQQLLDEMDAAERAGVRLTGLTLDWRAV